MWYLLGEVGDRGSIIETTTVIGLVVAKTKLDPIKAIQRFEGLLEGATLGVQVHLEVGSNPEGCGSSIAGD